VLLRGLLPFDDNGSGRLGLDGRIRRGQGTVAVGGDGWGFLVDLAQRLVRRCDEGCISLLCLACAIFVLLPQIILVAFRRAQLVADRRVIDVWCARQPTWTDQLQILPDLVTNGTADNENGQYRYVSER